eukprot:gene9144-1232_t
MRVEDHHDEDGITNFGKLFNLPSWCAQCLGLFSPIFLTLCGIFLCALSENLEAKQVFQIIYIIIGSLYSFIVIIYMCISCCCQAVSCFRLYGWLEREGMNSSLGLLVNSCGYCLHVVNSLFSMLVVATFFLGGIFLATGVMTSMTVGIISISVGSISVIYAILSCCLVIFPITSYIIIYICCCFDFSQDDDY